MVKSSEDSNVGMNYKVTKSSPLVLRKHPFKIRIMVGNSNNSLISFTKFKLNSHNDSLR